MPGIVHALADLGGILLPEGTADQVVLCHVASLMFRIPYLLFL
jgi:hypothetical protein